MDEGDVLDALRPDGRKAGDRRGAGDRRAALQHRAPRNRLLQKCLLHVSLLHASRMTSRPVFPAFRCSSLASLTDESLFTRHIHSRCRTGTASAPTRPIIVGRAAALRRTRYRAPIRSRRRPRAAPRHSPSRACVGVDEAVEHVVEHLGRVALQRVAVAAAGRRIIGDDVADLGPQAGELGRLIADLRRLRSFRSSTLLQWPGLPPKMPQGASSLRSDSWVMKPGVR